MNEANADRVAKKIRGRGYWEIHFIPSKNSKKNTSLPELKSLIRESRVRLRGWDYPHYPTQTDDKQNLYAVGSNKIEAWIDWGAHKEVWSFTRKGEFKHYLALREDWFAEDPWITDRLSRIESGSVMDAVNTIYTVTEIYKFLKNIHSDSYYKKGAKVEIRLCNTRNRKVTVLSPGRAPILGDYWSRDNTIQVVRTYNSKEIKESITEELSLQSILDIFYQFNWDNPPISTIQKDLKKLLEGRL